MLSTCHACTGDYDVPKSSFSASTRGYTQQLLAKKTEAYRGEAPKDGPAPNAYEVAESFMSDPVPKTQQFFGTSAAREGSKLAWCMAVITLYYARH